MPDVDMEQLRESPELASSSSILTMESSFYGRMERPIWCCAL
jgi:hypothetical protein